MPKCIFEKRCRNLKRLKDKKFNEHHFFFPRNAFKGKKINGFNARSIKFKIDAEIHNSFHHYFIMNCLNKIKDCKGCYWSSICCYSTEQEKFIHKFVRSTVPNAYLYPKK